MARKTKESQTRTFNIRKDIDDRLGKYSEESMIPKTAIVEKALEEYLDKVSPIKTK